MMHLQFATQLRFHNAKFENRPAPNSLNQLSTFSAGMTISNSFLMDFIASLNSSFGSALSA